MLQLLWVSQVRLGGGADNPPGGAAQDKGGELARPPGKQRITPGTQPDTQEHSRTPRYTARPQVP